MEDAHLPRILYYSDVPPELSFAGATLIYRTLEHYPKDKLLIIQGMEVNAKARIPGVTYLIERNKWLDRLKRTRIGKWISLISVPDALSGRSRYKKTIAEFKPEAILSVSFQLMWVKAFKWSKQWNIPFHIVLHDDWLTSENYGFWQKRLVAMFGKMYLGAASRFCISPTMESYYRSLFGVHGNVLYPFRGKTDPIYSVPVRGKRTALKFCYAGSLSTGDFAAMLNEMAQLLQELGWELHLFSPTRANDLKHYTFLQQIHVTFHGLLPSQVLVRKMHEEMDVAVMINSFEHEETFRYNFSSKLVDYTSCGLPVLMWGAPTSGALTWAQQKNYTLLNTERSVDKLKELFELLKMNNNWTAWAHVITDIGQLQFEYEHNYAIFKNKLSSTYLK